MLIPYSARIYWISKVYRNSIIAGRNWRKEYKKKLLYSLYRQGNFTRRKKQFILLFYEDNNSKNGFSIIPDQKWRDMRNTLSSVFTAAKIKNMFRFMSKCGIQATDYIEDLIGKQIADNHPGGWGNFISDKLSRDGSAKKFEKNDWVIQLI